MNYNDYIRSFIMAISETTRQEINNPGTKSLFLGTGELSNEDAIELAKLVHDKKNIIKIWADVNEDIKDEGAEALLSLPYLQELNLSNSQLSDAAIIKCTPNLKLKRLYLSGTGITGKALASLLANHYLIALNVTDCPITGAEIENCQLPINLSLKHLYLENPLGDKGILRLLDFLPNLETLSICRCHNTNEGIQAILAKAKHLKFLRITDKNITDEAFMPLANYDGSLEELGILSTQAGSKTINYILQNQRLKDVDISSKNITEQDKELLKQHLEQNKLNQQLSDLTVAEEKEKTQFGRPVNFFQGKQVMHPPEDGHSDSMACSP